MWDRTVWVCKVGSDASFGVTVDGASTGVTHTVLDGNCEALYTQEAGVDENHIVAVTELGTIPIDSVSWPRKLRWVSLKR